MASNDRAPKPKLTSASPSERVLRWLGDEVRVETLVGDASNRAYCRVWRADGTRAVAALMPEPFEASTLPFLNVTELLRAIPIRVPDVIRVDGTLGIMLLEDLGDELLQDVTTGKRESYQAAIDMLVALQRRGAELVDDKFLPYRIRFDEAKFVQELDFFREHFLEGLRARRLTADEREVLATSFEELSSELCSQPYVLCHRDFHARNLMVAAGELALIDYQDARQGPVSYDLVSLLNDSYVVHDEALVAEMVERFERGIDAHVSELYPVAALQRNLKALGTFGFQIARRGNAVYERYIEHTLSLVDKNLASRPGWDRLRRILASHCEEIS